MQNTLKVLKEIVSRDFLLLVFFHESVSPKPQSKFADIFASQVAPLVSTTQVANLPPMSTTLVMHLELRISPRIFKKIRNDSNGILRGLGETDS